MLDLWQDDMTPAAPQPNEGTELPATFAQGVEADWNEGLLFAQSIAGETARMDALQDHIDDIRQRTGRDINQSVDLSGYDVPGVGMVPPTADMLLPQVNAAAAKIGQPQISADDLEQRAVAKSREAQSAYAAFQGREQTLGSRIGSFLGSTAAQATDPINLIALPIAPEAGSFSVLSAALRWGAVAGVSQAAIEATGAPYREEVQPGYLASGAPLENIAGAAAGGAVLGGVTRFLGNAWTRVKYGAWPQSVRDAGNLIESEANIAGTNVYPGVEGEVAHRQALSVAMDQILGGRPVDVSDIITPDIETASRDIMMPSDQATPVVNDAIVQAMRRPIVETPMPSGANSSKDLNGPVYVDPRVPEPLRRPVAVHETVEQVMMNRGLPYEQAHVIATQAEKHVVESSGMNWENYTHQWDGLLSGIEHEKVSELPPDLHVDPEAAIGHHSAANKQVRAVPIMQTRALVARLTDEAQAAGRETAEVQPQLPFEASAAVARMRTANEVLAGGVQQIAHRAGYAMPDEEAATVAGRLVKANPAEADDMLRELQVSPRGVAARAQGPVAPVGEAPVNVSGAPLDVPLTPLSESTLSSPQMEAALRADLDRERAMGDVKVPDEVDKDGNIVHRSLDDKMNEVDAYKTVADQIAACASPGQAEAA